MTILHARVRNGRVTVDEPTDLTDGAKVDLLLLDAVQFELHAVRLGGTST